MLTIRWLNSDPIYDLKKANLTTIRKSPKDNKMDIEKFRELLLSEHSTLRFLSLEVFDDNIPYTVATQLVRHTKEHCQPEMSSGRPDWNGGKARDYTQTRWYIEKFTPIGLIRMMESRLCTRAEDTTRDWAYKLKTEMRRGNDPYIKEIARFCRPRCIKCGYCPEGKIGCGMRPLLKDIKDNWL